MGWEEVLTDRYEAIRARAHSLLAEQEEKSGPFLRGDATLGSLIDLAKNRFKLAVVEDTDLPDNVIGYLDLETDVIGYRPGLQAGRRAFTIAHEIAHRALEHPERRVTDSDSDVDESPDHDSLAVQNGIYRSYNSKSAFELEANVFASEILAPLALVREVMRNNSDWSVSALAEHFGVSNLTMLNQIAAALRPDDTPRQDQSKTTETKPDLDHDRAVSIRGPALILAGPGAGKTRVLVRRYLRLVNELEVEPRRILALTFSNKAAAEMRDRLAQALPERAHELAVFTFHSFGLEALKLYGARLGFEPDAKLQTPAEIVAFLKNHLSGFDLGGFENLRNPSANLGVLLDAVSRAKDELIEPEEFSRLAADQLGRAQDEDELNVARNAADCGSFYTSYQRLLQQYGYFDYGDLISLTVKLLASELGDELRRSYDHILVDEFQDINFASGRLVKELAAEGGQVWAVGDLRQSIYRFRGASAGNISGFLEDYPGAQVITLSTNYRSFQDIVDCGKSVQIPIGELPTAELRANRGVSPNGPAVKTISAGNALAEINRVVDEVKAFVAEYGPDEVAVLCRTRTDAQKVSDALEGHAIPTNWTGDLLTSSEFRDLMGMMYLAIGDLRGLVRVASGPDYRIAEADITAVLEWTRHNGPSALVAVYAASNGEIDGLSNEGHATFNRLRVLVGEMSVQPTPFHAVATYLFQHSRSVRDLIAQDVPQKRRKLLTIRQACSVARSYRTVTTGVGALREFVEFVEACAQSGKLDAVTPDLAGTGCVTVATVHASKGLEWKAVILPFLAASKFPNTTYHAPLPIPQGVIRWELDEAGNTEEDCLFYVAVTRARDRLVISHAERYGRKANPSRFVLGLSDDLVVQGFLSKTYCNAEESVVQEPKRQNEDSRGFQFSDTIPFGMVASYQRCPKRFEYYYKLRLSSSDKGFRDFQRVVDASKESLSELSKAGNLPNETGATDIFERIWAEIGPEEHWYGNRYKDRAHRIVTEFHKRLTNGKSIEPNSKKELAVEGMIFELPVGEIETGTPMTYRVIHYDKPAESHRGKGNKNMLPALLASGGGNVEIYYPLSGITATLDASAKIVEKRPGELAEIAKRAQIGPYLPSWQSFSCPSCPFALICSAEGSGGDSEE